jgi:hypothetical protein
MTMNSWIDLHALWKIVVVGLLAGAGLPMLFGIGLRALNSVPNGSVPKGGGASTQTAGATDEHVYGGNPVGLVIAVICFAVVLAAIGWGINSIVAGS